jgi:hypothetical protein
MNSRCVNDKLTRYTYWFYTSLSAMDIALYEIPTILPLGNLVFDTAVQVQINPTDIALTAVSQQL